MDKKVFAVVPVYNVERFLKECVDSLLNQTYRNIEVVLVDDGSTDSSGKMCDDYAAKDSRVKVVHQKNQGLFCARKSGVSSLTDYDDSYCFFCDSDDSLPYNAVELLVKTAQDNDCNLVCGDMVRFSKLAKPATDSEIATTKNIRVYSDAEVIEKVYPGCFGMGVFPVSLCAKLYKTSIVVEAFTEVVKWPKYFGEDLNTTLRIIPKTKKVAIIDNVVYNYRQGGGTSKFMKTLVEDSIFLYYQKIEHVKKYNMDEYYLQLIDVEMKNMALQYLVMCIRTKTYPHGDIYAEIKYISEIPEFYNAVNSIRDDTLKRDFSEAPGFVQAFKAKDYETVKSIVSKRANENKLKRFLKRFV